MKLNQEIKYIRVKEFQYVFLFTDILGQTLKHMPSMMKEVLYILLATLLYLPGKTHLEQV